ncbi:MAG: YD repeat-containing protein [Candidatus Heimdallarchaeota archaeon]|nr:YD repeat-containing protein [Candidatus Heimdallarchaeota archaeon]
MLNIHNFINFLYQFGLLGLVRGDRNLPANRLVTLTQTGGSVYTYTYNGLGDRLSQTVDGVTTRYTLQHARLHA